MSALKRELDLKSTQLVWECKKLSESEARLHKAERDKARLMNDTCKMKMKLQEALEKQGHGMYSRTITFTIKIETLCIIIFVAVLLKCFVMTKITCNFKKKM